MGEAKNAAAKTAQAGDRTRRSEPSESETAALNPSEKLREHGEPKQETPLADEPELIQAAHPRPSPCGLRFAASKEPPSLGSFVWCDAH